MLCSTLRIQSLQTRLSADQIVEIYCTCYGSATCNFYLMMLGTLMLSYSDGGFFVYVLLIKFLLYYLCIQVFLKNLPPNSALIDEIMDRVKGFLISKGLLKGDPSTSYRPLRHLQGESVSIPEFCIRSFPFY
jgi:hypothetical protein